MREEVRNAISHAHQFTVEGAERPVGTGLMFLPRDGAQRTLATTAEDLYALACRVEELIEPMTAARNAVARARPA
jgi:hypothetical protein